MNTIRRNFRAAIVTLIIGVAALTGTGIVSEAYAGFWAPGACYFNPWGWYVCDPPIYVPTCGFDYWGRYICG